MLSGGVDFQRTHIGDSWEEAVRVALQGFLPLNWGVCKWDQNPRSVLALMFGCAKYTTSGSQTPQMTLLHPCAETLGNGVLGDGPSCMHFW